MRRAGLWLSVVAVAVLGIVVASNAQSGGLGPPPFPTAVNDGCQRSNTGLVTDTSPSWVYVNRDPTPKFASGVVGRVHLSNDDLSTNHDSYDFNSDVHLDPPYTNLLGGDPSKRTGNFQPTSEDESVGTLHVERESKYYPLFAWPQDGDRVAIWGAWIWDCAHWSPGAVSGPRDPGQPGEKTEIHAIRAIAVTRKDGALANRGQTQADVYISPNGTFARAEEQCALRHAPVDSDHYDPGFSTCKNDPANRFDPVNDTDYTFFIPAPSPKPGSAKLQYRVVRQQPDNAGAIQVATKANPPGIQVTIPFKSAGGPPTGSFARTFLVGWTKPLAHPPAHLAVKIESYKLLKALDPRPADKPFETSKAPDEDVVTLDVNGVWRVLDTWAPKLLKVRKGQTVKIGKTIDVFARKGLTVNVNGFECDSSVARPPCPSRPGETDLSNDKLGQRIQHLSLRRAIGRHTIKSPDGIWKLTYSVRRK